MPNRGVGRYARIFVMCLAAVLVMVSPAAPQAAVQQGRSPEPHPDSIRDFMFGRPRGSVALRGSWVFASAGSDLFEFVTDQLTLEGRDFNAPAIGAELGIAVGPRIEARAGVDRSKSSTPSEYRRFVDNNNLPITQETRLETLHLSGSVKVFLTPRGQSVSRLAWIPSGITPYVGAGAGAVRYDFVQSGDFVDFVDLSAFTDVFQSKGWAPSAHVFGGADLQIYRILFLELEGRYQWSTAALGRDFIDFDPIDLTGFRMIAGVSVLF